MRQIAIAFDQLINTFPFMGMADETLSARAWRLQEASTFWGLVRVTVDTLFFFDRLHCYTSYIAEFERKHLPEEYNLASRI